MSCFSTRDSTRGTEVEKSDNTRALIGFYNEDLGTFQEKLSISKDFQGVLYIDLKDINLFKEKLLLARFSFGRNSENPIELPLSYVTKSIAGVEKGVLALSIPSKNFFSIPLDYQLYDYSLDAIAGDNAFHEDVYCRGLKIEDDPTSNQTSCSKLDDRCLYTYARVDDQGLFHESSSTFIQPTELTVSQDESRAYEFNLDPINLRRCLSDQKSVYVKNKNIDIGELITLDDEGYRFKGAFKPIDPSNWGIQGDASWGRFGIFQAEYSLGKNLELGYKSNLFPRAGKIINKSKRYYLGSKNPLDQKVITNVTGDASGSSAGLTDWVDGCNLRVLSRDSLGKNIGSCNVTSNIQIFYRDGSTEVMIYSNETLEKAGQVKLQIVNNISTKIDVQDFNVCVTDSGCSSTSCCNEGRCWDRTKYKDMFCKPSNSGKQTGQVCNNDTECLSACCIGSLTGNGGVCADSTSSCKRQVGESCIHSDACDVQTGDESYYVKRLLFDGFNGCKVYNCNIKVKLECISSRCTSIIDPQNKAGNSFENPHIGDSCKNRINNTDCSTEIDKPSEELESCFLTDDLKNCGEEEE